MTRSKPTEIYLSRYPTPVGSLHIASTARGICRIAFGDPGDLERVQEWIEKHFPVYSIIAEPAVHREVHRELKDYFEGRRRRFNARVHLVGTDFQLQTWTALRSIPYGETRSYKQIADIIGNPTATRAVGGAIGQNPIPIIVPCHRVIGDNGKLVGFSGGIERKQFLLQLEGVLIV